MSDPSSEDLKASPEASTYAAGTPRYTQTKKGQTIILVPQPSDDPEDPLVCLKPAFCVYI